MKAVKVWGEETREAGRNEGLEEFMKRENVIGVSFNIRKAAGGGESEVNMVQVYQLNIEEENDVAMDLVVIAVSRLLANLLVRMTDNRVGRAMLLLEFLKETTKILGEKDKAIRAGTEGEML